MNQLKEQNTLEALPERMSGSIAGNRRLSIAGSSRQWHKVFFMDLPSPPRAYGDVDYL